MRRAALITAAAGLAVAGLFLSAGPAAAHDELITSDPADGATVDTLPTELTLVFSAFPLTEQGATLVEVTDAAGADLTSADPVVDGTEVTQELQGSATGVIEVVWKVVSSDGHPIDGEFSFTVGGGSPAPTATTTPEPTETAPAATTSPGATETSTPVPADDDAASPALLWTIAGVVLAAVVAVVVYLLTSRARRRHDLQRTREGAVDGGDSRPDED